MNTKAYIKMEDILLCDPISSKGKESLKRVESTSNIKMSISDFYEKVYVKAFFEEEQIYQNLIRHYQETNDIELYNDFSFSDIGSTIRILKEKKEKYEELFLSENSCPILFIRAASGSGKSIYLNYLKRERRKKFYPNYLDVENKNGSVNQAFELNFDVEKSLDRIEKGEIIFPSSKYLKDYDYNDTISAPWSFFVMLVDALFDLCMNIVKQKISYHFLKNFKKIYGFDYSTQLKKLIDLFKHNIFLPKNNRNLSSEILISILDLCFKDSQNVANCIRNALETLTRLMVCNSNLEKPKQVLISFDNIEHFINSEKRIYDEDIKTITNSILNFVDYEKVFYETKNLDFSSFFKFILVIRDTTDKMITGDVHESFTQTEISIDVSNWFSLDKIYKNKMDYCKDIIEKSPAANFLEKITDDCKDLNSNNILQQVSSMYNHNNRRTTKILTRVSTIFDQMYENPQSNSDIIPFETFETLLLLHDKKYVKYLCKQAVFRMIYNEISRTGFFSRICNNIVTEKSTYARRILTWLSNKHPYRDEQYVSFYDIIKQVYCCPEITESNISSQNLIDFAEILLALDEHKFTVPSETNIDCIYSTYNCWCQLVILKYNNKDSNGGLSKEELAKKMVELYRNHDGDSTNFGIRITEAGYCYARNLRDFEYLSCRYNTDDSTPLVMMKNVKLIEKTLKTVFDNTKEFIEKTILFEDNYFHHKFHLSYEHKHNFLNILEGKYKNYQSLPYRIITQHIHYLSSYRKYILDNDLHEKIKVFSNTDRGKIIEKVEDYIENYRMLLNYYSQDDFSIEGIEISDYSLYEKIN